MQIITTKVHNWQCTATWGCLSHQSFSACMSPQCHNAPYSNLTTCILGTIHHLGLKPEVDHFAAYGNHNASA